MFNVNHLKRIIKKGMVIMVTLVLVSCTGGGGSAKFENANGQKKYKKENGEMAQAEWVTIGSGEYYFDMNGNLKTNSWVDNEFYVGNDGKKLVKSWHEDKEKNKKYYLSSSGKYLRDTLATIGNSDYYFNSSGELIIDRVFDDKDGNKRYADKDGKVNQSNSLVAVGEKVYFIDKMGKIFTDGWKEIGKDWYCFNYDGSMKKNEWYEATYYLGSDGKMLKNATSPDGYEIDGEGKVLEKYKSELLAKDFSYVYQLYCKFPWADIGKDGSYISIDTNPDNADDKKYEATMYMKDSTDAIKKILEVLGFPSYVYKNMGTTSYSDGKQTEVLGNITVTWSYHPDEGLEVMFMKKK